MLFRSSQTTTLEEFIQSHMAVLAGIDFFTVEVLTWRGLKTYYVLFFIHLESRRFSLAGITRHPDHAWMQQMARNATGESWGLLDQRRYTLHDRDTKFCPLFRATLKAGGIEPIRLPATSHEYFYFTGSFYQTPPGSKIHVVGSYFRDGKRTASKPHQKP